MWKKKYQSYKKEDDKYENNLESEAVCKIESAVTTTLKRKLSDEQAPITLSVDDFLDELCCDIDEMDIDAEIQFFTFLVTY